MSGLPPKWPDGKRFAFTIFDDPDSQPLEESRLIYSFLGDLGFCTTKGVWPQGPYRVGNSRSETCDNPEYRTHVQELQTRGFEIGFHGASLYSSQREQTAAGLERFREYFGAYPTSMSNHFGNAEGIYWGAARLTGIYRMVYATATLSRRSNQYFGERQDSPYFWGDLCRDKIRYCRNFVYREINTLKACPMMPYHDPLRPMVKHWYASSEGANAASFVETIQERNQDALEEEGGACIMYAHLGKGFAQGHSLLPRFRELMERLSRKNGWFVPAGTLLDAIQAARGDHILTSQERSGLERRWLARKLLRGTS